MKKTLYSLLSEGYTDDFSSSDEESVWNLGKDKRYMRSFKRPRCLRCYPILLEVEADGAFLWIMESESKHAYRSGRAFRSSR